MPSFYALFVSATQVAFFLHNSQLPAPHTHFAFTPHKKLNRCAGFYVSCFRLRSWRNACFLCGAGCLSATLPQLIFGVAWLGYVCDCLNVPPPTPFVCSCKLKERFAITKTGGFTFSGILFYIISGYITNSGRKQRPCHIAAYYAK